jgi:hypothetical protein
MPKRMEYNKGIQSKEATMKQKYKVTVEVVLRHDSAKQAGDRIGALLGLRYNEVNVLSSEEVE